MDNQTKRPIFTRKTKPVSHQFAEGVLVLEVSILLGLGVRVGGWGGGGGAPVILALWEMETGGSPEQTG